MKRLGWARLFVRSLAAASLGSIVPWPLVTRTLAILFGFTLALLHGKALAQDVSLVSVPESADLAADECTCGDVTAEQSRDWFEAASVELAGEMSEYEFEQMAQTFPLRPLWCLGTDGAQCSEDKPANSQTPSSALVLMLVADVADGAAPSTWIISTNVAFGRRRDSMGPAGVTSSLERPPNA